MNHNRHAASGQSEPHRSLRADFTVHTMRHAAKAKRRVTAKQQIRAFFKEPFSMKSLSFLRTAPGAVLAVAILGAMSASAYALTNWFNADVTVKQNNTVLSVDLSECKGKLPPGVESGQDQHNVQFKILGNPHISVADLRQQLLAECEYQAVVNFYRNQPITKSANVHVGKVIAASDATVRLAYQWGAKTNEKTFTLSPEATVYIQGSPSVLRNLQAGDSIVFATRDQAIQEGVDPLDSTGEALSVFKTQYDMTQAISASKNGFYEDNNIMPLDMYKQLHK
jgi:hypothetical protein